MKRYVLAAGALFLGASVLGLAADAQTTEQSDKSAYLAKAATEDKAAILAKSEMGATDAKVAMGGPEEPVVATTASAAVVQPSNANPELDARGIAVISDVAYVPPGFNGIPAGAMGGPVEAGDEETYPPCTAERTDNCLQTYERGRSG